MKVFITWSGDRSLRLARKLREWLPAVLPFVNPWVSLEDIEKGTLWTSELSDGLTDTPFGILCVMPENKTAHWLLFEAGALSRSVPSARVTPLLLGLTPEELPAPLRQFQAAVDTEDDIRRLLRSINRAAGALGLAEEDLDRRFGEAWPDLRETIESIRRSPAATPAAAPAAPSPRRRLPEVSDQELWILREMEQYGGRARREFHTHRGGSSSTVNSIWFGMSPVDYDESRWIYDAMEGSLKRKGLIESRGNDYFLTPHGERVVTAEDRNLEGLPPIIDALTGRQRE